MADLRGALPSDAADLALLFGTTPRVMALRLEALARDPSGTVLVALGGSGAVVGVVALHWAPSLQTDRAVAKISALVVAEDERRQGIGRALIKAAAQSARVAGCDTMEIVATGAFFDALGFVATGPSLSRRLRKQA
ncbi:GNAT family N-acetyltransferase [Humitalea sp. 24SJ18S-53]|uniref:GNAT family N-acetyltransferase n=1 Tax=Humitalea sp. 24SJ18S-53 TaxID=3422307 RepID=UPI003D679756